MKKTISCALAAIMAVAMLFSMASAAAPSISDFSDAPAEDSWMYDGLALAVENGIMNGHNGKLYPNGSLTRAEMTAMVVRVLGAGSDSADISRFTDVSEDDWFASVIKSGVAIKIIEGSGNNMNPNDPITREQSFVILSRAFSLTSNGTDNISSFADAASVSSWAANATDALIASGIVRGSGNMINPKASVTRAEFATMLSRLISHYYKAGSDIETFDGGVVINSAIESLSNVTIDGDLYIGDGVGDSEIVLENVTVTGRIVIRSGRISLIGESSAGSIVLGSPIRAAAISAGEASVSDSITVGDSSADVTIDASADKLDIYSTGSDIAISADSSVSNISVYGSDNTITFGGTAELLFISEAASNTDVTIAEGATIIDALISGEGSSVSGDGRLDSATIKSNDTTVSTDGTEITDDSQSTEDPDDDSSDPNDTPNSSTLPGGSTTQQKLVGGYITYSTDGGITFEKYNASVLGSRITFDVDALAKSVGTNEIIFGEMYIETAQTAVCYHDGLSVSFSSNTEVSMQSIIEDIAAQGLGIVEVSETDEPTLLMLMDRMETAYAAYSSFAESLFEARDITCVDYNEAIFEGRIGSSSNVFELRIVVPNE